MASIMKRLRRAGKRRAPRPRGHAIAGMRSSAALNVARLQWAADAAERGGPPGYRVTRRWPR